MSSINPCDWSMTEPWKFVRPNGHLVRCGEAADYFVRREDDTDMRICAEHLPWFLYVYGPQLIELDETDLREAVKSHRPERGPVRSLSSIHEREGKL